MGALSRIHLLSYKSINEEINRAAEEVNWKYGTDEWNPILSMRRLQCCLKKRAGG